MIINRIEARLSVDFPKVIVPIGALLELDLTRNEVKLTFRNIKAAEAYLELLRKDQLVGIEMSHCLRVEEGEAEQFQFRALEKDLIRKLETAGLDTNGAAEWVYEILKNRGVANAP